jgi:signal transduction histidine kinase
MPPSVFDVMEPRAGSSWLARDGRDCQAELLAAVLSRFNHDLRTPLNTVVSWAHLLQQGLVDRSRTEHVADVLARNTREQTVLLDEFVDDGRAVLGVLKTDPVGLRIEDLVDRAIERAAPLASRRGVSCARGGAAQNAEVEGDERHLPRLVYRLLAAIAGRARAAGVVELSTAVEGASILLRIEAPAGAGDWSDAALLDLRISSFVAALHDAELSIDGAPGRSAIALRLPLHA